MGKYPHPKTHSGQHSWKPLGLRISVAGLPNTDKNQFSKKLSPLQPTKKPAPVQRPKTRASLSPIPTPVQNPQKYETFSAIPDNPGQRIIHFHYELKNGNEPYHQIKQLPEIVFPERNAGKCNYVMSINSSCKVPRWKEKENAPNVRYRRYGMSRNWRRWERAMLWYSEQHSGSEKRRHGEGEGTPLHNMEHDGNESKDMLMHDVKDSESDTGSRVVRRARSHSVCTSCSPNCSSL
ncbi:hypothetical protein K469DRAFT_691180 [Zopfia rhizophila CBS 207.26]|uniref:Uncharacterized protein n=1 Tax=Zopfia rhizophila CBS 207.26 TaxID=1314779 RepID=A0A6A6ERP0_9PEZI|nr:hypothetical protein K469DRAFT_691180 [Zopfia rhizophila CBS 207.26]